MIWNDLANELMMIQIDADLINNQKKFNSTAPLQQTSSSRRVFRITKLGVLARFFGLALKFTWDTAT